MKVHTILIILTLIGLFAVGISGFIGAGVTNYAPTGYNSSYFDSLNRSNQQMIDLSEDIRGNMTVYEGNPDLLDYITGGAYLLISSVKAAWVAGGSTVTLMSMTQETVGTLPLSSGFSGYLIATLGAIILIMVIVGLILYIWTKSERI